MGRRETKKHKFHLVIVAIVAIVAIVSIFVANRPANDSEDDLLNGLAPPFLQRPGDNQPFFSQCPGLIAHVPFQGHAEKSYDVCPSDVTVLKALANQRCIANGNQIDISTLPIVCPNGCRLVVTEESCSLTEEINNCEDPINYQYPVNFVSFTYEGSKDIYCNPNSRSPTQNPQTFPNLPQT